MPLIFEQLDDWRKLTGSTSDADASELHGLVCGLLAADPGHSTLELLSRLETLGEWDWTREHREYLAHGIVESAAALDSEDFSFAPLLPTDHASLDERTACLGVWCGGFIAGYGAGDAQRTATPTGARAIAEEQRTEDTQAEARPDAEAVDPAQAGQAGGMSTRDEVLRDLEQISRVEVSTGDDDEAGTDEGQERAYTELVEYVRMAVMLMRQTALTQQH